MLDTPTIQNNREQQTSHIRSRARQYNLPEQVDCRYKTSTDETLRIDSVILPERPFDKSIQKKREPVNHAKFPTQELELETSREVET